MTDSTTGAGNVQVSLEQLIVPESKKVLTTTTNNNTTTGVRQGKTGAKLRSCQWPKLKQFEQ